MGDGVLLDVSHASKRGTSIRISIPRKVVEKLGIGPEDIIGFYLIEGRVLIEKLR